MKYLNNKNFSYLKRLRASVIESEAMAATGATGAAGATGAVVSANIHNPNEEEWEWLNSDFTENANSYDDADAILDRVMAILGISDGNNK